MVPDTQAAERRMWNSNPSAETRVTNGEGVSLVAMLMMMTQKKKKKTQGNADAGTAIVDTRIIWSKRYLVKIGNGHVVQSCGF